MRETAAPEVGWDGNDIGARPLLLEVLDGLVAGLGFAGRDDDAVNAGQQKPSVQSASRSPGAESGRAPKPGGGIETESTGTARDDGRLLAGLEQRGDVGGRHGDS